jgi:hypothetical protein
MTAQSQETAQRAEQVIKRIAVEILRTETWSCR